MKTEQNSVSETLFKIKDRSMGNVHICGRYANMPMFHKSVDRNWDVVCFLWSTNIIHSVLNKWQGDG
jgi:hypothetical protein